MDNNKLNKTFSSLQGAYTSKPKNSDNQPAYKSKEKNKSIYEDLNNSKNIPANEAAAIVNEIKFRKVPYVTNLQKPKIVETKDHNHQILKYNFLNSFTIEKEKNSRKQMPVSLKGNYSNFNNFNSNNTSALNFNLNNSNLNSSVFDTSLICNRGHTEKSETGSQQAAFAANLPIHVNSISITSKNTKAQVITSDFNYYLIGAKKNKRNASSGVYVNYSNNNLRSKKVAYSRDSSETRDKRNQSCDYISNNTDNTSKKSNYENDEVLRENRSNNKNLSMIAGQAGGNQGQAYNANYMNFTSNAYANAKSKEQREKNKLSNSHAVFDRDFSDDNLSSDVSEPKKKLKNNNNNDENSNNALNSKNTSKPSKMDFSSLNNIPNTNINNFNELLSNKDSKSRKTKSKEKEFVIENQNLFSEISGLNLSSNVNNLTFMSNNNNTENLISDFNLQKNLSFDQEKANENLINFDEYNLFEKNLSHRISNNERLREVNEILNRNENSAFSHKIKVYFNNTKIEQDKNFKYKKFLDEKFPPSYKSFFSMKQDNNTASSCLINDESDETFRNKKMNALNSGKFNNIIFKRPSDVIENYDFDLFAEKLENCVYTPQENYVNPAFNTVLKTIISKFPFLIYRIFRTNSINYSGYYEVILHLNNKWQIVYVDDFLPYDNKAKALFGTSQIWKLILEKAIAKASGGYINYMLLEAHTLFNLVTGLNSVIFENNNYDLFNYIVDCIKNNFCLCAKYPNFISNSKLKEDVYLAITDAFEIIEENNEKHNYKLIKLRKPSENFLMEFEIKNFDFIPSCKFNENMIQEITNKEAFDKFGYIYVKYSDFQGHFDYLYCCMSFVNDENLKKSKKKNNVLIFKNQKEAMEALGNNLEVTNKNDISLEKLNKDSNNEENVRISKLADAKEESISYPVQKEIQAVEGFIDDCFTVAKEVKNETDEKKMLNLSDNKKDCLSINNNIINKEGNGRYSYLQEDNPTEIKEEKAKASDKKEEKPAVKKDPAKPKRKGSHDFGPEKADEDSEDEKKPSAAEIAKEREAFKAKFQSCINKANEKDKNPKPLNTKNASKNVEKKEVTKKTEESASQKQVEPENLKNAAENLQINSSKDLNSEKNNSTKDKVNADNEDTNKKQIEKENNKASSLNNTVSPNSNINSTQNENASNSNNNNMDAIDNKNNNNSNSNNSTQPEAVHQSTPVFKKEEKKSALKKLKEFEMGTSEYKKMEKMKQLNEKNAAENSNKGLTTEQIYENLRKENKKEDLVNNIFSPNPVASLSKKDEAKPESIKNNKNDNTENKTEDLAASLKDIVEKNKKKKWEEDNKKIELKRIEEEKRIKEIVEKNEKEYELMMQKGAVSKPIAEAKKNENDSIDNIGKSNNAEENPILDGENKSQLIDEKLNNVDKENSYKNNNNDFNGDDKQKEKEALALPSDKKESESINNFQEQPKTNHAFIDNNLKKENASNVETKDQIEPQEKAKSESTDSQENKEEVPVASSSQSQIPKPNQADEMTILPINQSEIISPAVQQNLEKKDSLESPKEKIDLSEFNTEFSEFHKGSFSALKYYKDLKPIIYKGEKFIDKQFPPEIKTFIDLEKHMLKSPLNKEAKRTPSLFSNALNIINSINDPYDNSKIKAKLLSEIKIEDIVFKRASEVLDNFTIINRGIENLELTKSLYEQCLYCVFSVLANTPQIIFNLKRTLERNDYGYYEMNLFIDGIWQIFYVDDFLPFSILENKFIGYANIEDQLWPMLLEKAFAKACGGYYEMFCTDCSKFLSAFTGMESGHVKIIKNDIFEFVHDNIKKKSTLISNTKDFNSLTAKNSSSVNSLSKSKAEKTGGLKAAYYYVILDAFEICEKSKITKIIKIGSPWEKVDFEGEWGVNSINWDEALKKKYFNSQTKTKFGYAFLTIDEFVKNFDTVFFSLNNPNNLQEEGSDYFEATAEAHSEAEKNQADFPAENIKETIYREDKDCFSMKADYEYFNNQSVNFQFTKRFTDPFFPANKSSLLSFCREANDIIYENARTEYEAALKSQKYDSIVWRRVSEINSLLNLQEAGGLRVLEDITAATKWPDDFDQSRSDGYFQTIIAALIKKPSFIDKLIRTKRMNKFCYYEVLLYIDRAWKIVFVDDFMPFDAERDEFLGVRLYQNQIWPLILQKAWAKVCGGYLNMSIMNPTSCITALTSFEAGFYETAKLDLFQFVYDSLKNGYYLMAKSKREHSSLGLQPNFYYLISNCFETSQNGHFFKLLKIRAPWKGFDWSGQWGLQSPIWEEDKKQIMWKKSVYAKNGFFIVNYEEFVNNFDCLFFCFVNINTKEENKLPNFQIEYGEVSCNDTNANGIGGGCTSNPQEKSSSNSVNRNGEFKKSNSLSANYADLQMINLAISSSSYFSTTKYITPINGLNKYDNSAESLNIENSESYYFWNLDARTTSNILDILISNSNKRKKKNIKQINFADTPSGVKSPKAHVDFLSGLLKTIEDFRATSKQPVLQDERNLIRLLQKEQNLVANLLFSLEPGSPLDSQWYYKELKNNGVWLSQYDIGNQHIAFHAVKKHVRMGIYKGNLQWGKSIIFDFFYEDENSNFFYSFDGVNIDGQKQGEGKFFKKPGFNYYAKEVVELNFNNDLVQTGKFIMPDGCVWNGPVKNDFYKSGTGTIKTPEGKSWQSTFSMDTFIK